MRDSKRFTAMAFAAAVAVLLLLLSTVVEGCSSNCRAMDGGEDSCLICSATTQCGVCASSGITTTCKVPGTVHLTIDDGPFDTTPVALDILAWKNVKATFFLLGMQIANRESIVEAMIAQGHNIGSHSWDHPHFNANTTNIVQQLERTRAEIFRAVGRNVTDFRPPFGECNRPCMETLATLPYTTRLWNLDTLDYVDDMNTIKSQVDNTMYGFDLGISAWVIGMHLKSNLGLCALPRIIDRVRARGYKFVTADECWGTAPVTNDIPLRVGIPAKCNPVNAPMPLAWGACGQVVGGVMVGCAQPSSCCSEFGFCGRAAANCGPSCKNGWCNECRPWVVQNATVAPPWQTCTTSSPQFINACTTILNGGCSSPGTAACVMTGSGTRNCTCNPGYTGSTCSADLNECATSNGGCHAMSTCINLIGSRNCSGCRDGYSGDGVGPTGCTEIDECALGTSGCDVRSTCVDTTPLGNNGWRKFTCVCNPGLRNVTATTCVNINECATNNGGCAAMVTCTDADPQTPSAPKFACGNCPTGYELIGNVCRDINECALSVNGGCSPLVNCYNTAGSYYCATGNCTKVPSIPCGGCPTGYTGNGVTCTDINECQTGNGGCHPTSTCFNTPGSRSCGLCGPGMSGDGITCTNVNECANATLAETLCTGQTPICTDLVPSFENHWVGYTCTACGLGYTGSVGNCVDINECLTAGACANLPGINCHNMQGSYYCAFGENCPAPNSCPTCPSGYSGNGKVCVDTDECLIDNGQCDIDAVCTNTVASRTCSCKPGYTGTGLTCTEINECATDNGGCDSLTECEDLVPSLSGGNFRRCGVCPEGYTGTGQEGCHSTGCDTNPCLNGASCTATGAAFVCTCESGFAGTTCAQIASADGDGSSSSAESGRLSSIIVPTIVGGMLFIGLLFLCSRRYRSSKPNPSAAAGNASAAPQAPDAPPLGPSLQPGANNNAAAAAPAPAPAPLPASANPAPASSGGVPAPAVELAPVPAPVARASVSESRPPAPAAPDAPSDLPRSGAAGMTPNPNPKPAPMNSPGPRVAVDVPNSPEPAH